MRILKKHFRLCCLFVLAVQCSFAQRLYFPDSVWQKKAPAELKLNAALIDSAVQYALQNEVKMETDLRIANMKSYSREPGYKILGPMRERGKPAGLIIKNGYIVAQWGDVDRVDMTLVWPKVISLPWLALQWMQDSSGALMTLLRGTYGTKSLKGNTTKKLRGAICLTNHPIGRVACLAFAIGPTGLHAPAP
jgi:hypothetical protein